MCVCACSGCVSVLVVDVCLCLSQAELPCVHESVGIRLWLLVFADNGCC
uniref:Uncharacterized protein n=1 Tax=Anguilla anguilla TaxID=7936 RepID=A0A0E9SZ79_ANGAN